jgi:hypothetical protein
MKRSGNTIEFALATHFDPLARIIHENYGWHAICCLRNQQ